MPSTRLASANIQGPFQLLHNKTVHSRGSITTNLDDFIFWPVRKSCKQWEIQYNRLGKATGCFSSFRGSRKLLEKFRVVARWRPNNKAIATLLQDKKRNRARGTESWRLGETRNFLQIKDERKIMSRNYFTSFEFCLFVTPSLTISANRDRCEVNKEK